MRAWGYTPVASTVLGVIEVAKGVICSLGALFQAAKAKWNNQPVVAHLWEAGVQAKWILHGLLIAIPIIGNIGIYYLNWANGEYNPSHPISCFLTRCRVEWKSE